MRDAPRPRLHLFVCANRREGSPLGPGCAGHGDSLYDALKRDVARRGCVATTWITKTHCLGICPKHGATVARYPSGEILTEAVPADLDVLLAEPQVGLPALDLTGTLAREVDALEELQRGKVLDLARRLKPGLTLE